MKEVGVGLGFNESEACQTSNEHSIYSHPKTRSWQLDVGLQKKRAVTLRKSRGCKSHPEGFPLNPERTFTGA